MVSLVRGVLAGIGYVALSWVALMYAFTPDSPSIFWFPVGFAIGVLWWWRIPALIGILISTVILAFGVLGITWVGVLMGLTAGLGYGAVVYLLHQAGFDPTFRRPRDLALFLLYLALVLAPTAGAMVALFTLAGRWNWDDFWTHWFFWWGGDMVGAMIVGTPLLAWHTFRGLKSVQWAEIGAITLLTAGVSFPARSWHDPEYATAILKIGLPLLLWGTIRYQLPGLTLSLLAFVLGFNPQAGWLNQQPLSFSAYFHHWVFWVVSYLTLMVVAIYVRQARETTARLEESHSKLEQAYQQLEAIIENAPTVAIQGYDLEGRVMLWNQASEKFYGYSKEEALGKTLDELIFTPEQAQEYLQMLRQIAETGQPAPLKEWKIRTVDGRTRYILSSLFPIRLRDETIFICADIDITERRQLEHQLFELQKMESIGRLAGGIAHDFNNLLTAVIGFAEIASSRLPPDHPAQADLVNVVKSAEKAAGLTRQLLGFARRQMAQPRPTELNSLVRDLLPLLQGAVGETITIEIHFTDEPTLFRIDPVQMEQILLNLALNARDAMPTGGTLRICTERVHYDQPPPTQPTQAKAGDYVCLVVQDTGVGIPPEHLDHIFEPFFTTKGLAGHGMGLAVVYGIVAQNGGHIFVESEVGKGTTFRICFPALKEQTHSEAV